MTPRPVTQRQRETLSLRFMRRIARLILPFVGKPVTNSILAQMTSRSFRSVEQLRHEYRLLATRSFAYHLDIGIPPIDRVPKIRAYEMQDWAKAVNRSLQAEDEIPEGRTVTRQDVSRVLRRADLHGRNAERNTMVALSVESDEVIGWARVDPIPPTCPLCRLTISRGPVYSSAQAAGSDGNDYHTGCTCEVVPVRSKESWPGREQYLKERQLYRQAKGSPKAYRALVKKANKDAGPGVTQKAADKLAGLKEKESPDGG